MIAERIGVASRVPTRASRELDEMLRAFHASTRCHAALLARDVTDARAVIALARSDAAPDARVLTASGLPTPAAPAWVATPAGDVLLAALPGVSDAWLAVGPCEREPEALPTHAALLRNAVAPLLRATQEAEQAAEELTERYEEINLLYTISEILGRAVTLEETAATILREVSETVGAARATIHVHDAVTDTLQPVAALGTRADQLPPIDVDAPRSVTARVFRTLHPEIADAGPEPGHGTPHAAGARLAVPIVWSTREGGEPLGVVSLSGRRVGSFTAGDLKLVTAIATQIAAAIQNARLVRASLQQERLAQEMALAHDLQMRLLPSVRVAAPDADVAARVVPAESVGGDFYNLFRLGERRTGLMIGDVSSHGYRAALIMALAMSATAIHAQDSSDPAETLGAVLGSLGEELESTEMFISAFYAVVDPARGTLHYANAGHPHAFVVREDGTVERLLAGGPPLGMIPVPPSAMSRPWAAGRDLLLLFTDGISDAVDPSGARFGEEPVLDAVVRARALPPAEIAARVFDVLDAHIAGAPLLDDLTLVLLRS